MTSFERHEARYQRRKATRERKRREKLKEYDDFSKVADTCALTKSHLEARGGVLWKASVARYDANMLKYSAMQSRNLYNGKYKCQGFYSFCICERGKLRNINSVHYSDRVVRRSACINALVPILSHNLIYDNGASLKGKGVSFSANRCDAQLHRFFRETGSNEGYAILTDFSDYFKNIRHTGLHSIIDRYIRDKRLNALSKSFIAAPYEHKLVETPEKGLFIGPEDSQIYAVAYPNDLDHKIKDQCRYKYYNRYMDDTKNILKTKTEAHEYLNMFIAECDKKGIVINKKKTQIVKLSHGFTYLKTRYILTETGKVIKKPDHKAIVRERRKLKKQKRLYDAGEMTLEQVSQSYMSWRGSLKSRNAYRTILSMDRLFFELFSATPWKTKSKKRGKKL